MDARALQRRFSCILYVCHLLRKRFPLFQVFAFCLRVIHLVHPQHERDRDEVAHHVEQQV